MIIDKIKKKNNIFYILLINFLTVDTIKPKKTSRMPVNQTKIILHIMVGAGIKTTIIRSSRLISKIRGARTFFLILPL